MARGVKQQKSGLDTDFSITDAAKRAAERRKMLEDASGMSSGNKYDDISDELETEGMSDYEKDVFEN